MGTISRQPAESAKRSYDLIIIGGGIYGVMLSFEASRRGLRSLLLEKDDFGGATSYNHLRIIHGGLRYLQGLDLHRFRESVTERKWFLKRFPHLVNPLPCMMPLYGEGLRRSSVMRVALRANDLLASKRNQDVLKDKILPDGKVVNALEARKIFPGVETDKLQGGAVWYDAIIPDPQRVLIDTLRRSCAHGGSALNYAEATGLLKTEKGVAGVIALDRETGTSHEYRAGVVINAAGPWSRNISTSFDRDKPSLFKHSIAWNVLFKREALSEYALALTPGRPGAQTYFLLPWKGILLAGTGHAPCLDPMKSPVPPKEDLHKFLGDLNEVIPGMELGPDDIIHIFSGYLPVKEEGGTALTSREVIYSHGVNGGPPGLFSVSGIKFTTSRLVAEKTLTMIFQESQRDKIRNDDIFSPSEGGREKRGIFDVSWFPEDHDSDWRVDLKNIIVEESVVHLDDLILRRTSLGDDPERALKIVPLISDLFNWDSSRTGEEMDRLKRQIVVGISSE